MIGVLVFTHGDLCSLLRGEAERLIGSRDLVDCLSLRQDETIDELTARCSETVTAIDQGLGVLVLVDVVGGTPWNVAGRLKRGGHRIRRIGGVGLPVFIKALSDRGEHKDLDTWADELVQYAKSHVATD